MRKMKHFWKSLKMMRKPLKWLLTRFGRIVYRGEDGALSKIFFKNFFEIFYSIWWNYKMSIRVRDDAFYRNDFLRRYKYRKATIKNLNINELTAPRIAFFQRRLLELDKKEYETTAQIYKNTQNYLAWLYKRQKVHDCAELELVENLKVTGCIDNERLIFKRENVSLSKYFGELSHLLQRNDENGKFIVYPSMKEISTHKAAEMLQTVFFIRTEDGSHELKPRHIAEAMICKKTGKKTKESFQVNLNGGKTMKKA